MPLNPATGEFYENMTSDVVIPHGLKSKHIAGKLERRGFWTPDFHILNRYKSIPIFLYGTEMTDGINNDLLRGAKFLGKAHTLSPKFWMKQTSINPIVFDSHLEAHKDNRKVRGEVYEVQVEHVHMLDVFHRNRVSVKRTNRNIIFEDCKPQGGKDFKGMSVFNCMMYIGSKTYWKDYDLKHRITVSYAKKENIKDTPFYEWVNWAPDDDDEWGWYGRWGGSQEHSPHVG